MMNEMFNSFDKMLHNLQSNINAGRTYYGGCNVPLGDKVEYVNVDKTAVGMYVCYDGQDGYPNSQICVHSNNIIICDMQSGDYFKYDSKDEYPKGKLRVINRSDNFDPMDTWVLGFGDGTALSDYKKDESVNPLDRLVTVREEVTLDCVGRTYDLVEAANSLYLVSREEGKEISLFVLNVFLVVGDGKPTPYRHGRYNIEYGNTKVRVDEIKDADITLVVLSGIEDNSAPISAYQKVANAVFGYGAPTWYGMILLQMLDINVSWSSESYEELLNIISGKMGRYVGPDEFNGNVMASSHTDSTRKILFPMLFGANKAYELMRDGSFHGVHSVKLLGNGMYILYDEDNNEITRGSTDKFTKVSDQPVHPVS